MGLSVSDGGGVWRSYANQIRCFFVVVADAPFDGGRGVPHFLFFVAVGRNGPLGAVVATSRCRNVEAVRYRAIVFFQPHMGNMVIGYVNRVLT